MHNLDLVPLRIAKQQPDRYCASDSAFATATLNMDFASVKAYAVAWTRPPSCSCEHANIGSHPFSRCSIRACANSMANGLCPFRNCLDVPASMCDGGGYLPRKDTCFLG